MTPVFEHIEQAQYLLRQLLEGGFLSGRGHDDELQALQSSASTLGLATGSQLLRQLSEALSNLRAGHGHFSDAARLYSALTQYYDFVANKIIIETIID